MVEQTIAVTPLIRVGGVISMVIDGNEVIMEVLEIKEVA